MIIPNLPKAIRKLRLDAGLTQEQLAIRLGVVKTTIAHYESGDKTPSFENLMKLARIFNVSTDYLLGLEKSQTLDLTGFTEEDIRMIRSIADYIREKNKTS